MTLVQDRAVADCFVVASPASPDVRTHIAASLSGGMICDAHYVKSRTTEDGVRGTAIAYQSALRLKRFVFLSPRFVASKPGASELVLNLIQRSQGRWKTLVTMEDLLARARNKSTKSQVIALLTTTEQSAPAFQTIRIKLTLADLPVWFSNIDVRRTHCLG